MREDEPAAKTLDCVSLLCPEPLIRTRKAMEELAEGEILEVFADDPTAEEDLTRLAKRGGHEVLLVEDQDQGKRLLIRKGR